MSNVTCDLFENLTKAIELRSRLNGVLSDFEMARPLLEPVIENIEVIIGFTKSTLASHGWSVERIGSDD